MGWLQQRPQCTRVHESRTFDYKVEVASASAQPPTRERRNVVYQDDMHTSGTCGYESRADRQRLIARGRLASVRSKVTIIRSLNTLRSLAAKLSRHGIAVAQGRVLTRFLSSRDRISHTR